MVPSVRVIVASVLAAVLAAADDQSVVPAPAAAVPADPGLAVIAEGASIYRQRDLDALLLVAMRHARTREFAPDGRIPPLGPADEDRIRQALIRAFTAREALQAALAALPEQIPPAAREAIALDVLAYRAEAAPVRPAEAVPAPTLVRLPPFSITRTVEGQGRRQLSIGLAIGFADAAQAKAMEAQAPIIQDAVLSALRSLPAAAFLEPDHAAVKRLLGEAIRARIPAFPAEGLLVPQLEAGPADAPADR